MDKGRERIYRLRVDEDIHFYEVRSAHPNRRIVKRSIALAHCLESVVEVEYDFGKWHIKVQLYTLRGEVVLIGDDTAFFNTERHHLTYKSDFGDDARLDIRLFHTV